MDQRDIYWTLIELGNQNGFRVTCPWNDTYQEDMTVWNRRLQSSPAMIAFCEKDTDVVACVKWCQQYKFPFRIRSGGHHHEGLSSAWQALIMDLSKMNSITYEGADKAWIPVGKQLQHVYQKLWARGQIIPGGGCETVCVGGLTLGGGWGMSGRMYGLTCDNILDACIILADGTYVSSIAARPDLAELFWALKGGGAGNFGIVTRFLFRLSPALQLTTFSLTWKGEAAVQKVLDKWLSTLAATDPKITTACRLYLDQPKEIAFSMFGQVYGSTENAKGYTKSFTDLAQPFTETYSENKVQPVPPVSRKSKKSAASLATQQATEVHYENEGHHFSISHTPTAVAKPADTCLSGPLPHKVSSAFVRNEMLKLFGKISIQYLLQNVSWFENANAYLSLHSFGGAIGKVGPDQTAFPYRDRLLLLQFQAWWSDPSDLMTKAYVDWIRHFRTFLADQGLTDGGFFNFQDMDIVPNYSGSVEDKLKLLQYYYGAPNRQRLLQVKKTYDPQNFFNSPMSVPIV